MLLRPPLFAILSSWFLPRYTKSVHLSYSQMGNSSILAQFRGLFCLGCNIQALLKSKIGGHVLFGQRTLSKYFLMFETYESPYSLIGLQFELNFECSHFYLLTLTHYDLWSDRLSCWSGWTCHMTKPVLQPILCRWGVLQVVTFSKGNLCSIYSIKNLAHDVS